DWAATVVLAVLDPRVLHQLFEGVGGLDAADGARARTHDDGVRDRAAGDVANPLQERAARDPGGGHEDVLAGDQVVGREDAIDVVAGVVEVLAFVVVAWPEAALHAATQALEGGRGDHAFGCAADAHEEVDAGALVGGRDGGSDVAVGDQHDPGAGFAEVGDELL